MCTVYSRWFDYLIAQAIATSNEFSIRLDKISYRNSAQWHQRLIPHKSLSYIAYQMCRFSWKSPLKFANNSFSQRICNQTGKCPDTFVSVMYSIWSVIIINVCCISWDTFHVHLTRSWRICLIVCHHICFCNHLLPNVLQIYNHLNGLYCTEHFSHCKIGLLLDHL